MNTKRVLRIAAGCLLFFALGHTIGHMSRHNVTDPKAVEVQKAMMENKFNMFGKLRSYDENYTGMSLNLIFTLLAFVILLWLISALANENPLLAIKLLIPVLICVAGFTITGFMYFFLLPALTCLLATVLLTIALIQLHKK